MYVNVVLKQSCYLQGFNSENSYTYRYFSITCGWIFVCFTDSACSECREAQASFLCSTVWAGWLQCRYVWYGHCVPGPGHRFCHSGQHHGPMALQPPLLTHKDVASWCDLQALEPVCSSQLSVVQLVIFSLLYLIIFSSTFITYYIMYILTVLSLFSP